MLSNIDIAIRLFLALIAGALVGLEREKNNHPAGLRTHMLVSVGSAIITIASIMMSVEDPTKIAAGIVTGIGFLGAGTIFRDRNHVRGLTTAASLWAVAGVGLTLGAGYYFLAGVGAVLLLFTLELGRFSQHMHGKKKR